MKFVKSAGFLLAGLCVLQMAAQAQVAPPPPASTMRPVDMTTLVLDPNGRSMPDGSVREPDDKDCKNCPSLTVGRVVSLALNAPFDDEKNLGWAARFDRATLAKRIKDDPNAVLDSSETATIERLLGRLGLNGTVLLQVIGVIDPNVKPGKIQ